MLCGMCHAWLKFCFLQGCQSGRWAWRRPHAEASASLYLILDDFACGYSIREVDLPSSDDPGQANNARGGGAVTYTGEQPLPPPIFRFEAQRKLPLHFAAAFGSKILALQPMTPPPLALIVIHPLLPKDLVPVYDVHRLFGLSIGAFETLGPLPYVAPPGSLGEQGWEWDWSALPKPPFKFRRVTSFAVHPDGGTIFVTRKRRSSFATFTFDTIASEWKRRGGWALPFAGRAHFDRELDAWVGLPWNRAAFGHLCSCDVVGATTSDTVGEGAPDLKLTREKLFGEDPEETHVGATLVHMGGRSEFCLVECVSTKDRSVGEVNGVCQNSKEDVPQPVSYLLRVTTFSLKYDKKGELITGDSRWVSHYIVPKQVSEPILKYPVAFCM